MLFFFLTKNIFFFFILFELSVYPIIFILSFWGYQIERIQAVTYLFFFTIFFSIPSFFIFLKINFNFINFTFFSEFVIPFFFVFLLKIIILVKIPFFFFHIWLPKAHLEAPTIGSIILASILLKLGSYGILKFNLLIFFSFFEKLIFFISFFGIIYCSFICFLQRDFKRLVAYSRIVHINFIISVIITIINYSVFFCFLIIFYHGIVSSLIFIKVGYLYYFSKTRKFYFLNLSSKKNNLFIYLIIIFILNFRPPSTLGFFSEIYFFIRLLNINFFLLLLLILFGICSRFFCIFVISIINFNKKKKIKFFNTRIIENIIYIFFFFFRFINFIFFF